MENYSYRNYKTEGKVKFNDLDLFEDLKWEEKLFEVPQAKSDRRNSVNLTSSIEDYIRSYL